MGRLCGLSRDPRVQHLRGQAFSGLRGEFTKKQSAQKVHAGSCEPYEKIAESERTDTGVPSKGGHTRNAQSL